MNLQWICGGNVSAYPTPYPGNRKAPVATKAPVFVSVSPRRTIKLDPISEGARGGRKKVSEDYGAKVARKLCEIG